MKHLLGIEPLDAKSIVAILDRADANFDEQPAQMLIQRCHAVVVEP